MNSIRPLVLASCLLIWPGLVHADDAADTKLANQAQAILKKCCARCHGDKGSRDGKINYILDAAKLRENKKIVAGDPSNSKLYRKIVRGDMPPEDEEPRPTRDEIALLERWIKAGAPAVPQTTTPPPVSPALLAARTKTIFRNRCLECHGGSRTSAGIKILDHDLLLNRKHKVVPGQPDASPLFQLVTATGDDVMPPAGQPRLSATDVDVIRQWIVAGAPPFPADAERPTENDKDKALKGVVGVDYVLKQILDSTHRQPEADRRFLRFFSINHLLCGGASRAELDLERDALAKAINHLTWEPQIVQLKAIDTPVNTIFAVDLRQLGWHRHPYDIIRQGKAVSRSTLNLFDLVLLEYPYGVIYENSETFDRLNEEFLRPSGMVRPIPYVRADWFVSVATQPPLYEDLLQLPFDLTRLETMLGVEGDVEAPDNLARRAGMAVSGVSRNNRVVERRPMRGGSWWKSFDFSSSKGRDNIFTDPIHLHPAGGEMIFSLPNGLQGYYLATGRGDRLAEAPTAIVTDKFAEDKTVRNGLACIRCHDQGMKGFEDGVRPALQRLVGRPAFDKTLALALYPEQAEMERYLREDGQRFRTALEKALGKPQEQEPLTPVTQRFLDGPLQLGTATAELGLAEANGLATLFRTPQFAGLGLVSLGSAGVVRRDMWEDYYDQVVRQLDLGVPVVPLDGLGRHDFAPPGAPKVEFKTSKKNNVFEPGDDLVIFVTNRSRQDIFVELIGTSSRGRKAILTPTVTRLKPGETLRHPSQGALAIQGTLGREQITLFAGFKSFPEGTLLRGHGVADRVVHSFYELQRDNRQLRVRSDPEALAKKTIVIETR